MPGAGRRPHSQENKRGPQLSHAAAAARAEKRMKSMVRSSTKSEENDRGPFPPFPFKVALSRALRCEEELSKCG
ncbi:hypothetical protein NDU88_000710 [Pleurodeles waltl]|uniref:Uncharacterized protein n=1 Tax=Pleurodeles waltl TaxID=8319 RepID=A0AAV7UTV7_PLEWA|nr:hypothetical protein NDU88_000710 [Pleurodeles waltl]